MEMEMQQTMDKFGFLLFRNRICNRLKLYISPLVDLSEILGTLNQIVIPGSPVKEEHIVYVILELLNNSIRAQMKAKNEEWIFLDFYAREGILRIEITDHGGGFDVNELPYDLNAAPSSIDLNSESFQKYRETNDFKRFGMGLYLAKTTFSKFHVSFIDKFMNEQDYHPSSVIGTKMILILEDNNR